MRSVTVFRLGVQEAKSPEHSHRPDIFMAEISMVINVSRLVSTEEYVLVITYVTAEMVTLAIIVNFHHCHPNPCQNGGTCINEADNYRCVCPFGVWAGPNCTIRVHRHWMK
ncbi:uncharacterized protein [Amphiura filiformis]|uniref:uncharacterized protein n=1 Tax=Amphiura filiformis TaxID=82378 RepID=UPI003B22664E